MWVCFPVYSVMETAGVISTSKNGKASLCSNSIVKFMCYKGSCCVHGNLADCFSCVPIL